MIDYKIDFNSIPWENVSPGVKEKRKKTGIFDYRLVVYSKEMPPHWCEKGHYGIVLNGEIEIEYNNSKVKYGKGDGILIPSGFEHRHKAIIVTDKVLIFFLEE